MQIQNNNELLLPSIVHVLYPKPAILYSLCCRALLLSKKLFSTILLNDPHRCAGWHVSSSLKTAVIVACLETAVNPPNKTKGFVSNCLKNYLLWRPYLWDCPPKKNECISSFGKWPFLSSDYRNYGCCLQGTKEEIVWKYSRAMMFNRQN